jgi:hypothetical protein
MDTFHLHEIQYRASECVVGDRIDESNSSFLALEKTPFLNFQRSLLSILVKRQQQQLQPQAPLVLPLQQVSKPRIRTKL